MKTNAEERAWVVQFVSRWFCKQRKLTLKQLIINVAQFKVILNNFKLYFQYRKLQKMFKHLTMIC